MMAEMMSLGLRQYTDKMLPLQSLQKLTHRLPRTKIPQTPIFCLRGMFRRQIIGMGRMSTAMLRSVLMVASATRDACTLMQCPGGMRSQK